MRTGPLGDLFAGRPRIAERRGPRAGHILAIRAGPVSEGGNKTWIRDNGRPHHGQSGRRTVARPTRPGNSLGGPSQDVVEVTGLTNGTGVPGSICEGARGRFVVGRRRRRLHVIGTSSTPKMATVLSDRPGQRAGAFRRCRRLRRPRPSEGSAAAVQSEYCGIQGALRTNNGGRTAGHFQVKDRPEALVVKLCRQGTRSWAMGQAIPGFRPQTRRDPPTGQDGQTRTGATRL